MAENQGIKATRLTIKDDVRTPEGLAKALRITRGKGIFLWASMPCTGGSPWQHINALRARCRRKIAEHRENHLKIWKSFEVVAEQVVKEGNLLAREWPNSCSYWREPHVRSFIERCGLKFAQFDGCAFGMRTARGF